MHNVQTESETPSFRHKAYLLMLFVGLFVSFFFMTSRVAYAQTIAPPVIEEGNPFLDVAFNSVLVGSTYTTTRAFALGADIQRTAFAYAHPQSPNFGDTQFRERLLYIMDFATIDYGSGSFGLYENVAHAYALLKKYHPNEISAPRKAAYENYLTSVSDSYVNSRQQQWQNKQIELSWYNAEVRWALGLYLSGIALDNNTFKSVGSSFFDKEFQEAMLQPYGGINYVGYQNETYTYHNANVMGLAWYYLISGDEDVREIIERTAPYWPLMTYNGMAEYYTAASWKHYWNMVSPHPGAYVVGALSYDPYNLQIAQTTSADPLLTFLYNPNLPNSTVSQPDNYTMYDKNIEGPRGRYSLFGFAGTGRVVDNYENYPASTTGVGKSTLVGVHVMKPNGGSGFSFDSVADIVGMEIKYATGQEIEDRRRKYRFLTTNEKSSTTGAKQIHGLTSTYNPSSKTLAGDGAFNKLDWVIHEQWILLPERVVGHLTVNSLIDDHQVYAINSIVKTLSGRGHWGDKKELVDLGNGHYSFGRLHFIIKEQNLNGATVTEPGAVYSDTTRGKATLHRILDSKSSGLPEQKHAYNISDKYYYVVEFFEEGTSPASSISSSRSANIHTLTVDDGTRKVQSVLNITGANTAHNVPLNTGYASASMLRSWEADQAFDANFPASVNVTLPANQSILAIESSTPDDVNVTELYYEDVFVATRECVEGAPCKDISLTQSAAPEVDLAEDISYTLTISNSGETGYTDARIIDILPYNGNAQTSGLNFSGAAALVAVSNVDRYYISGDAPATISTDPDIAELNNTWCTTTGTRVFGSGSCPATLANVTAVYAMIDGPIDPNSTESVTVVLGASNYDCGNLRTNAAGLRVKQVLLPFESVSVSMRPNCLMGDVNCDNQVDVIDALYIMQHEVGARADVGSCPLRAADMTLHLQVGDVNVDPNVDTNVDMVDALFIMQCEVNIANLFCP